MKEAYEQQIRQLKDMLREFEEDSERGSKATHEILQKWNEHKCPNVEQIIAEKEQKQRQLDEAYESQKQLEKKLKDIKLDLSAAYEDELNRMSAELEAKIDAFKEQENEIQSLLQIIKRMEQAQKDTNEFNQMKEIRIREESVSETTERLTQQWEQKVKDMKSTYEETAIREQQLTDQVKQKLLDELLVTRTKLEECEKSQITQKLQSESALNATQTELSALRGRLQKLDEALCSEQRLKETLIQKHKKEAHRLREECSELKSKIRLVENQLASVKNTQLENTEKTTAEKVKKLQNQNADLELRLTVMQNEINTCKTQWEYQKRRWCDGVVRLKEDLNVLLKTFSMIKENVSWEIKQLVKEVFKIKKNTGDHIQTLITSYHERMMETIRKDSENQERKSQVGKHRVELENIRYKKLVESLRQEKEAQRLEFTKKNDELQKEISSLEETYKKSLKCSESAWQKAQSSAAEMQARLDETQSKLTETTHEVDQLKKKCECLQKRVKMEKSCRFTDLAAELDRKWAETMGRECARVRDETTSKMEAELSIKLESKEIALRMEKTKLDWEYREMVVALEAELERVKSSEARLRDIVSKYEVMLSQHQNQTFTDIKNEAEKAEDAWEKRSNKSSRITTPVRDSGKVVSKSTDVLIHLR
ncbi:unnamed protein product [Calicophoron daubneyi]|uniref:Uncharacterized protein n=1 Tax=Calicophoron daubneyi TaxID=300641 RepID=A0AAV2T3H5_CALDB